MCLVTRTRRLPVKEISEDDNFDGPPTLPDNGPTPAGGGGGVVCRDDARAMQRAVSGPTHHSHRYPSRVW